MPIELRGSDVVAQLASSLSAAAKTAGTIADLQYEAARVNQINEGTTASIAWLQEYNEKLPNRQFEIPVEPDIQAKGVPAEEGGATIPGTLGEVTPEALDADYTKWIEKRREKIKLTVTNRAAREHLLAELEALAVRNAPKIQGMWGEAFDHAGKASLVTISDELMKSNEPWESQVSEIQERVDTMVRNGQMWKDEAEIYMIAFTTDAQNSFAKGGALQAVDRGIVVEGPNGEEVVIEGVEAAERWINDNTPFYDGNPAMRMALLREVRAEHEYARRQEDLELDRGFADLHLKAETLSQIDTALALLGKVDFHDGDQKYIWGERLNAKRRRIETILGLDDGSAAALEAAYKLQEDRLIGAVAIARWRGDSPAALFEMVTRAYRATDENGESVPRVRGQFVEDMRKELDLPLSDDYDAGVAIIMETIKKEVDAIPIVGQFLAWFRKNPEASQEDIFQAAHNLAEPVQRRKLAAAMDTEWWPGALDNRFKDHEERLREDISAGLYIATGEVEPEYLEHFLGLLLHRARTVYPGENIIGQWVDWSDTKGTGAGAPILVGEQGVVYTFLNIEKRLVLHKEYTTDEGVKGWMRVEIPEATAEKTGEIDTLIGSPEERVLQQATQVEEGRVDREARFDESAVNRRRAEEEAVADAEKAAAEKQDADIEAGRVSVEENVGTMDSTVMYRDPDSPETLLTATEKALVDKVRKDRGMAPIEWIEVEQ